MKKCKKCDISKPIIEYHNKKDGKDGFHSYCKICVNDAYDASSYRKYQLNKLYGITPEQHDVMLFKQQNKCAICRELLSTPHVDHCHTTGKVRGLLCINCNHGIGKFKDNIDMLQHAINYLKQSIP